MSTLHLSFHLLLLALLFDHQQLLHAQPLYHSSASLSTTWINSQYQKKSYADRTTINTILLHQSPSLNGPAFAFGFYCTDNCQYHLLSIFIVFVDGNSSIVIFPDGLPQVVWSANRGIPVGWNATLDFTKDGNLVLKDHDGNEAWSTSTTGMSVAGMNLTESGNLILFNGDDRIVWQSFEHPTDTLLSGQSFGGTRGSQYLTANASATNWTKGELYISYTPNIGFQAFVGSNPPQNYYTFPYNTTNKSSITNYSYFLGINGEALTFISYSSNSSRNLKSMLANPPASTIQFLRLEFDGHLKLYEWVDVSGANVSVGWSSTADIIHPDLGDCGFPMVCGEYGICQTGQCKCPQDSDESAFDFKLFDYEQPTLGCVAITPLSCKSHKRQGFLELRDVSYFNYMNDTLLHPNSTTKESCQHECLNNCSCKAAFFRYGDYESQGSCYLHQEVFSLMSIQPKKDKFNSTAYIKIQHTSSKLSTFKIVGIVIGVSLVGLVLIAIVLVALKRRGAAREEKIDEDEDNLLRLPGLSARFSYDDLRQATKNFTGKLGSGGFGTVFEGTLENGTRVAVKKLESVLQGKKEFLREVETIGSIHHFSLVRLVGYCAESSHRLLVYEYMSNGSLDSWIFQKTKTNQLTWATRCKIMYDVAKGLLYLHEDCRQKIAHLDIKPQNILLDSNFNAKVSDFGLAKLIDRDQSAVMTIMRGTPGYLAPEWLTSIITEKADVYSFGIVIVEIVCGKKNLDDSRPFERMLLLPVLKEKAVKGQLLDLVDDGIQDRDCKAEEIEKMLRLALWCSQNEPSKRPSMSMVVKVLEGVMDVNDDMDYDSNDRVESLEKRLEFSGSTSSTALIESDHLSGPR